MKIQEHFLKRKIIWKIKAKGNSLVVQGLGLCALMAEGLGSIPGCKTKIPQDAHHGQKKKEKN